MPGQQGQNSAIKRGQEWCVGAVRARACRDPFSFSWLACRPAGGRERGEVKLQLGRRVRVISGWARSDLARSTLTGGVKVPPKPQRNINGKQVPQKRRRQPPCRALRCSVLAPSFGKTGGASLDLDWPELEPDCPGRPTDKQQHSTARHSRAQHSNSNRDPFLLPWISPRLDISTANPSGHYHSAARPPPTLASLVARDTSSQPSP